MPGIYGGVNMYMNAIGAIAQVPQWQLGLCMGATVFMLGATYYVLRAEVAAAALASQASMLKVWTFGWWGGRRADYSLVPIAVLSDPDMAGDQAQIGGGGYAAKRMAKRLNQQEQDLGTASPAASVASESAELEFLGNGDGTTAMAGVVRTKLRSTDAVSGAGLPDTLAFNFENGADNVWVAHDQLLKNIIAGVEPGAVSFWQAKLTPEAQAIAFPQGEPEHGAAASEPAPAAGASTLASGSAGLAADGKRYVAYLDDKSSQWYYFDEAAQKTQWEKPAGWQPE